MRMLRVAWISLLLVLLASCGNDGGTDRSGNGDTTLTLEVSGAAWVAYQDGDGPWQLLVQDAAASPTTALPKANDAYRQAREGFKGGLKRLESLRSDRLKPLSHAEPGAEYTIPIENAAGRYGVTRVCVDSADDIGFGPEKIVDVVINLNTLEEDSDISVSCFSFFDDEESLTYTLSGDVSGLDTGEEGAVYAGFADDFFGALGSSYALELEEDVYDLVATKGEALSTPNKIIVRNDLPISSNQTLDLDFDGNDAFAPQTRRVAVTGAEEGEEIFSSVRLRTNNRTYAVLGDLYDSGTFVYAVVPRERLSGDAFYTAYARSRNFGPEGDLSTYVNRTFTTPEDFTLALPQPLNGADAAIESRSPYIRLTATWDAYPVAVMYNNFYYQFLGDDFDTPDARVGVDILFDVDLSHGWLGSTPTFDYTLPDFSGVKGWNNEWGFSEGEEIFWSLSAHAERGEFGKGDYEYISVEADGDVVP